MMIWMIFGSLAAAMSGLALCIYFFRQGQFEEPEEVKYQIFRDENPDS